MAGNFSLRIEDTDRSRFVAGAEEYIAETLAWCGIKPNESPQIGSDLPPTDNQNAKQQASPQQYADRLIADGNAYYAFDTPEQLEAIRRAFEAEGKRFPVRCPYAPIAQTAQLAHYVARSSCRGFGKRRTK